ncbi:MAG: hypothetical protein ACLP9L_21435 [Thermoguttaceae bacterium]
MDDRFASEFDPLPLLPDTPNPRPPDPPQSPHLAAGARGIRRPSRTVGSDLGHLARLLYSHNPFYCVSAFLVLWGLGKSFHLHGAATQPELLMTGLAGYALLLAAVGCLLIRGGQLWEDIRTILLLIVLIFLAISMSFDEVLSADLATGRLYFLGGLAFSVVLSELVLRAVRLRLPILFRLPYYALLALFFLYPLLLGPWQDQENDPHIRWLLAGFLPLAGLVALSLLPAIRRGANYVRDNGSPWQWPWYPWPLFVVLGVGVGLRSYALCVSFHPSRGPATMFEPYLLVPFLFAVNILLLEIGIASRQPGLLRWMMAAPLGLLLLSTWTFAAIPESINLRRMLLDACGCSPLFLTLLAVTALYAVALVRRLPHAVHWLTMATAVLVVVGPSTESFRGPFSLQVWPLVLLTAIQLCAAIRYRSSLHSLLTAVCAIALLCVAWPEAIGTRYYGAISAHLLLFAMLLIGAVLRDRVAQFLQRMAVLEILFGCVFVLSGEAERWSIARREVLMIYPGLMLMIAASYGYWLRNHWYQTISLLILACWIVALSGHGYRSLRTTVAGIDQITLGMACLLLGLLVSLWKLGIPQAWLAWWLKPRPIPIVPTSKTSDDEQCEGEV